MAFTLQIISRWLDSTVDATLDRRLAQDLPGVASTGDEKHPPGSNGRRNGHTTGRSWHLRRGRWIQVVYAIIDLCLVCINGLAAFWMRFPLGAPRNILHGHSIHIKSGMPVSQYFAFLMLYATLILVFSHGQSLYRTIRTRSSLEESIAIAKAVLLATLLLSAFVYLSGIKTISRLVVGYVVILNIITFSAWRFWKRKVVLRRSAQGIGTRNVLIVGAGRIGQALAEHIENNKLLGYRFSGFLDANHSTHPKLLGKVEDLGRIARSEFADEIFITIPSERELVKRVAIEGRNQRLDVKVVPDLYDGLGWNAPISHIGHFPVMELHWQPIPAIGLFFKRTMDVIGSAVGLVFLSPVFAAISIAIRLDSRGPVIYRSKRVGKKGRKFSCYKFRTMIQEADLEKQYLRHLNERRGATFKITNDPRITRLGRILRKYSLDELPQLWNVLKGDMSLVGPRPHPLDDYDQYSLEDLRRLDVKPGITGLWQVMARNHSSFTVNMKLDVYYIENWNIFLDIKILLKTLPIAISGSGV